jgi:hypothetical protein
MLLSHSLLSSVSAVGFAQVGMTHCQYRDPSPVKLLKYCGAVQTSYYMFENHHL